MIIFFKSQFLEVYNFWLCFTILFFKSTRRFLKSKVALLQTELEAGKCLNETLERENSKNIKKVKKLTVQSDKSTSKIESLESSLKSLQEKQAIAEQSLKVTIALQGLEDNFHCFFHRIKTQQ